MRASGGSAPRASRAGPGGRPPLLRGVGGPAQIFTVARQTLSLVAGGAIDVFLAGQLRLLRQEHTLARAIHGIQAALWPGGTWFMYRPEYPKRPVRRRPMWAPNILLTSGELPKACSVPEALL